MKKIVQVYKGKAHWIFEEEEKPNFAPNIELVDITDLDIQPKEGWYYNPKTGKFSEYPIIESLPSSEEIQTQTLLNTEYLVIMSEINNIGV